MKLVYEDDEIRRRKKEDDKKIRQRKFSYRKRDR